METRCLTDENAFAGGDLERAVEFWEESLAHFREVSDPRGVVMCLMNVGLMKVAQGDYGKAETLLCESLRLAGEIDHKLYVHYCTIGLGSVAASQGRPIRAARLWGATEGMGEALALRASWEGGDSQAPAGDLWSREVPPRRAGGRLQCLIGEEI